jgi:hypothetical protein
LAKQLTLFYSYAHEDEDLRKELEKHLAGLRREGLLSEWHDRKIKAGKDWADAIDDNLDKANIVLLLVSPDFMASEYCFDVEAARALQRQEMGVCRVVPVILRTADWEGAPFAKLQALPTGAKPVVEWDDRDAALVDIADGLRAVCRELIESPGNPANPYTIAKVGDWVELESTVALKQTGQQVVMRMRNEVIEKSDTNAVLEITMESPQGREVKNVDVNLEHPFEDNMAKMVKQVSESVPPNAVIDIKETGAGQEKLFIGENVYYATWIGKEVTISLGAEKMVATGKTWMSSEIPLDGIVKWEQHTAETSTVAFVVGHGQGLPGAGRKRRQPTTSAPPSAGVPQPQQPPMQPQQPQQPMDLHQILPGTWQVQIAGPMGMLTATFYFDPGGAFQAQINNPMTGVSNVQGQWVASGNQLTMQGQQQAGFMTVPYFAAVQFAAVQPGQLQGMTSGGEQVAMVKVQ